MEQLDYVGKFVEELEHVEELNRGGVVTCGGVACGVISCGGAHGGGVCGGVAGEAFGGIIECGGVGW